MAGEGARAPRKLEISVCFGDSNHEVDEACFGLSRALAGRLVWSVPAGGHSRLPKAAASRRTPRRFAFTMGQRCADRSWSARATAPPSKGATLRVSHPALCGVLGGGGGLSWVLKLNWRMGMVSKQDMTRKTSNMGGWTVTEILIVVVLIVLVVLLVRPNFIGGGHPSPATACISNLRNLDAAKGQWALELHKESTDIPTASDIQPYMVHRPSGELPCCPADPKKTFDSSYSINNVGTVPTCKILPATHILLPIRQ